VKLLKIIVKPHRIIINNDKLVNEREVNVSKCYFEFDKEITDDFVKEAYFTFKGNTYKQLIQNNECSFPQEVLTDKGQIEIGVVAYKVENEIEIIRYNPRPAYFNTLLGSLKDDVENSEEITPTDKEQMEQAINNGLTEIDNALTDLQEKVDSGYFKGEKGDTGETGATGATGPAGQNGINGIDGKDGVIQYIAGDNITIENNVISAEVPTKTSDLTNDSNFLESTDLKTINGNSLVGSGDITISGGSDLPIYLLVSDAQYISIVGTSSGFTGFTENDRANLGKIITEAFKKNYVAFNLMLYCVQGGLPMLEPDKINLQSKPVSITFFATGIKKKRYDASSSRNFMNYQLDVFGTWNEDTFTLNNLILRKNQFDMLTLDNTMSYTPTSNYNPATKKYVDDAIASAITTTLGGSY
jgi:hypothetical protein